MSDERDNLMEWAEFKKWSWQTWNSIAQGGTWAVPRSGLVFQKQGTTLVLIARMPYQEGMPGNGGQWAEYQESDYDAIKREFAKINVTVEKDANLA